MLLTYITWVIEKAAFSLENPCKTTRTGSVQLFDWLVPWCAAHEAELAARRAQELPEPGWVVGAPAWGWAPQKWCRVPRLLLSAETQKMRLLTPHRTCQCHASSGKISSFNKALILYNFLSESGVIWRSTWDFKANIWSESFSLPFFVLYVSARSFRPQFEDDV